MGVVFATVKPIRIVRGTRWQDQVQLVDENSGDPVDLTSITSLRMWIRADINAPVILELGIGTGLAIANPALGLVDIDVASEETLDFPEANNRRAKYVFDALIERSPDEFEPAFAGKVTVFPSITRPWAT